MKLDRAKKYEGLGLTWVYVNELAGWGSVEQQGVLRDASVREDVMQSWLDAGHIRPVKETKTVRVEGVKVCVSPLGNDYIDWARPIELGDGVCSRPVTLEFEVDA